MRAFLQASSHGIKVAASAFVPDVRLPEAGRPASPLDVLYITYDGLLEPLGRSQVVTYLEWLAADGLEIAVLSFEKRGDLANAAAVADMRTRLGKAGVAWSPLTYHRHPRVLATIWDVMRGVSKAISVSRSRKPSCLHARSYVAGLVALAAKALSGAKLVFDMRGFWPEERVELGLFRADGSLYRVSKRCERMLLESADHIVVLTENAKAVLRDREAGRRLTARRDVQEKALTVIPCCVDLERFSPIPPDRELEAAHGLTDKLVIGNIGAFNSRYLVPDMFRFAFHVAKHRPETVFVYLTSHEPARLRDAARAAGLADEALVVVRADPDDVPRWLSLFRLGVFFLRPSYAAKASSFTKLGEFLASGVPVVTNTGVGDVDQLLGSTKCGLLLPGLTDRELDRTARKALPLLAGERVPQDVRELCRQAATEHLALAEGVRRYHSVYRSLAMKEQAQEEMPRVAEAG